MSFIIVGPEAGISFLQNGKRQPDSSFQGACLDPSIPGRHSGWPYFHLLRVTERLWEISLSNEVIFSIFLPF